MVDSGILTKLTPGMLTPEWLNSFVIVKKPNGNLRVCLDLVDLNKSIIQPVCNMSSIYHRHIEHFFTFLAGNTVFSLVSELPR